MLRRCALLCPGQSQPVVAEASHHPSCGQTRLRRARLKQGADCRQCASRDAGGYKRQRIRASPLYSDHCRMTVWRGRRRASLCCSFPVLPRRAGKADTGVGPEAHDGKDLARGWKSKAWRRAGVKIGVKIGSEGRLQAHGGYCPVGTHPWLARPSWRCWPPTCCIDHGPGSISVSRDGRRSKYKTLATNNENQVKRQIAINIFPCVLARCMHPNLPLCASSNHPSSVVYHLSFIPSSLSCPSWGPCPREAIRYLA